jgi:DNA-binding response OmpR family regulator
MKTRSLVLLKGGYGVRTATNLPDAVEIFNGGDFDLVIICHSIPEEDRVKLIRHIRTVRSSAKIILMRTNGDLSAKLADETIHSLDGPTKLLAAISHSLGEA